MHTKTLTGTIFKGLGKGKNKIKQLNQYWNKKYKQIFYPGTLNVKLSLSWPTPKISKNEKFKIKLSIIRIEKEDYQGQGGITLIPCTIKNQKLKNEVTAYIVRPDLTHYDHTVIEIIAPINLRKTLKLVLFSPVTILCLV